MLVVSDIDGTLADNRHRAEFYHDYRKYFELAAQDQVNPVGRNLVQSLLDSKEDALLALVSTRPVYYYTEEGQRVNFYKETKKWLHEVAHLHVHELNLRDDNQRVKTEVNDKVQRLVRLVLEHINDREIVYIDDNLEILKFVKDKLPTVRLYHVNYSNYERLTDSA